MRARQVVNGVAGPVVSASYVVGVENSLPTLSIIADPRDLWDVERGILVNTWQRGWEWERPVHVTYVEGTRPGLGRVQGDRGFEITAGLRIHGSERFDAPKQSFRLYFRNEYGAARLESSLLLTTRINHNRTSVFYCRLEITRAAGRFWTSNSCPTSLPRLAGAWRGAVSCCCS